MKYMAPRTVQGMASEMQGMMNDYVMFKQAAETTDISQIEAQRKKINEKKAAIEKAMVEQVTGRPPPPPPPPPPPLHTPSRSSFLFSPPASPNLRRGRSSG